MYDRKYLKDLDLSCFIAGAQVFFNKEWMSLMHFALQHRVNVNKYFPQ